MKMNWLRLVLALSLAAALVSCSAAPSVEPAGDGQQSTVDAGEVSTAEGSTQAEIETEEPEENNTLSAYRELLEAAPAIEGEHDELMNAAFGWEENQELFGSHYDCFALYDVNQDETPELFALSTVNFRWSPVSVYTCAEGNAVLLKDPLDEEAHGTFEQRSTANGAYLTYFCEENHIHSAWRGTAPMGEEAEEDHAYVLEGTSLTETDCTVGETENAVYLDTLLLSNTPENLNWQE